MTESKAPSTNKKRLLIVAILGLAALAVVLADVFLVNSYATFEGTRIYTGRTFPASSTADEDSVYSYQTGSIRISVHEYDRSPAHFFVADVWLKDIEDFRCAFANGVYNGHDQSASVIAEDNAALLAVNSDFNWGLVIRNGVLCSSEAWDTPMLAMYRNGSMKIIYDQLYSDPEQLLSSGVINTWTFGPVLVDGGKNVVDEEGDVLEPRTAIGYYSPGHYCFVVVDGRQSGYSSGMLLSDLGDLMAELGCELAYNFDGGASSQLLVNAEIINRPSTNPARLQKNLIVIAEAD